LPLLLFAVGYPVAIVVIARWIPVVREQRTTWFAVHQGAVAAIVAGHAIGGRTSAVIINGAWWVVAALWYFLGGQRR
jgi:hypothetical protein